MIDEATALVERKLPVPGCELVSPLGQGAFATVWLARRHGAPCVVKLLHQDRDDGEVAERRFVREIQIVTLLDHDGIARVLDAGRVGDRLYLVGEHIHGATLTSILETGPPPIPIVLGIGTQLLDALAYAHDFVGPEGPLGLVHRDLTHNNVMVGFDGRVKVIDFGVARARMADDLTRPGSLFGTPAYMSPEQARGEHADRRSDLYAVAVLLYELAAGLAVTRGTKVLEILDSVMRDVPPRLDTIVSAAPAALADALVTALEKEPSRRFSDALAFRAALEPAGPPASAAQIAAYLEQVFDDDARRPPMVAEAPRARGEVTRAEAVHIGAPAPVSRRRISPVAFAGFATLAAAVVLGVVLMLESDDVLPAPPPAPAAAFATEHAAPIPTRTPPVVEAVDPPRPAPIRPPPRRRRRAAPPEPPPPAMKAPPSPKVMLARATALLERVRGTPRQKDVERLIVDLSLTANHRPTTDELRVLDRRLTRLEHPR